MEAIIKGFSNYTITNDGDVFSLNFNNTGVKQKLSLRPRKDGYITVCLCKDGKKYNKFLHRLVAEHFIPNPDNLPQVNHKDGDKSNCHDWNLEWCTGSDNMIHAHKSGLRNDKEHLSEICKLAVDKISKPVLQLKNDGTVIAEYKNAEEASRITGACRRHICSCCHNKRKTCGGWRWRYKTDA